MEQLLLCGFLEVSSRLTPGRIYRIPHHSGQVEVYEESRLKFGLCVGPKTCLPRPDVILAHKLMIEGDEAGYLHTANVIARRGAVS
ncbi:MAG: hypothetical protein ACYDAG_14885 [Chloroflexota bacterium]